MNKQTVKVPFRNLFTTSLASGVATTLLQPSAISSRLSSLSDNFELYRINRLRYRMHPLCDTTNPAEYYVASVYSNFLDTTPSFATVAEGSNICPLSSTASVPTAWVNVPKAVLSGSLPWYKAQAGAPDQWDEVAASFVVASNVGASAKTLCVEFEGEMEFKSPIDPGFNPEVRRERERQRVMRALAPALACKSMPTGK